MVFYTTYAHKAFDEEDVVAFEPEAVKVEAVNHLQAANRRAAGLSEGSSDDGILVFGPIDVDEISALLPSFQLFQLAPPTKSWTVKEKF